MEHKNCNHSEHIESAEKAMKNLSEPEIYLSLAEFFKVFGDSTRLKIISLLQHKTKLSVCCIADRLDMEQSAISHQLKVLRNNHIVNVEKRGKQNFYSLSDLHVELIYKMGFEHITEED